MLLVLRLLAIYAGAAAAGIWLVHRWVVPLPAAIRALLVLFPLLVTGKAMFTAGVYAPIDISFQTSPLSALRAEYGIEEPKNPNLGDVVYQHLPWRKAVREAVKSGHLPLWNRFVLAGEPLLAVMMPAVLHPFTWIGMLLPLGQAWTLEMTLGIFLALACGYAFFRDLALAPVACAIGATGWAFCDYLRFFAGFPLSPAAAPFPLLLLGLRRLARDKDRRAVGITIAALFLIIAAGQPETILHAVAGSGVWFLFCLGYDARETGNRAAAVLLSLVAGAAALGLTAVLLLPHLEAMHQTMEYAFRTQWWAHQKKSVPLLQSLATLPQIVMPYVFGVAGRGDTAPGSQIPMAYAGSVLFPLAFLGLAARGRTKWVLVLLAFFGFGMWAHLPVLIDLVSLLPLFDIAVNERLVFLGCFAVVALAALGADAIVRAEGKTRFPEAAAAALLLLCAGFLLARGSIAALHMPEAEAHTRFLLQAIPLLVCLVLWVAMRRARPSSKLAAVLLVFLLQRAGELAPLYPVAPAKAFYPTPPVLGRVPRGEPSRIAALGFVLLPNVSALYELEDVRGYETMTFQPLFETYPLWCVHQPVFFNRIDDPRRPFLSFLNVKHVLEPLDAPPPEGWKVLDESSGVRLLENPRVLPRAFVPAEIQVEPDHPRQIQLLAGIDDFSRRGVVAEAAGRPSGAWLSNGPAKVAIVSYRPDTMSLEVTAVREAIVATSVTGWKGWRLAIDGKPRALLEYNRAFLGFVVPAGRHRANLTYLPRAFVWGAAISALTLAAVAAAAGIAAAATTRRTRP